MFFRILSLTLQDAIQMRPESTAYTNAVLSQFAKTIYMVSPQNVPLFTYAWFDLIANRFFLPSVLSLKGQRGWQAYSRLLLQAVTFVTAAVDQAANVGTELPESVNRLIEGLETILTILNVDFPEFLVHYGSELSNELGQSKMHHARNLILSAVPRSAVGRLADPFTTAVKLDNLPDGRIGAQRAIGAIGEIGLLESSGVRNLVLQYVASCVAVGAGGTAPRDRALLGEIRGKFVACGNSLRLIQSFLHFVGNKLPSLIKALPTSGGNATGAASGTTGSPSSSGSLVPVTLSLDIFMDMIVNSDPASRSVILAGMINMLRYPNAQTSLFSIAVLFIFAECPSVAIKEEITRALMERLLVKRPHPWGVLATFSELVKNPRFSFWAQPFVKDDVENILRNLAVLCFTPQAAPSMGPSAMLQQIVEQQRSSTR
jgi:CCR4-NOT transcription complex subunit 1